MEMKDLTTTILSQFDIKGDLVSCVPFGDGHINTTYLVTFNDDGTIKRYVLQKINSAVFNPVEKLMQNIKLVTEYIKDKIVTDGGDPERECLSFIKTKDGNSFYKRDDDNYFRVYNYIEDTVALSTVSRPLDFYNSAIAFGKFNKFLDGFDASQLYEILPNFHNTKKRYGDFLSALDADIKKRAKFCKKEIAFIKNRQALYGILPDMLSNGTLPLRVTHNDTKLNNVLLDANSGKPVCVVDLDTIMPGSLCYDFGDSIRFGCNSAAEDEADLNKVQFNFELYKVYLDGFLFALGDNITQAEKDNLALASLIITIECGMRFLTDYLSGDTYFHITDADQNLRRAKTQLKLASEIEKYLDEMNALVK